MEAGWVEEEEKTRGKILLKTEISELDTKNIEQIEIWKSKRSVVQIYAHFKNIMVCLSTVFIFCKAVAWLSLCTIYPNNKGLCLNILCIKPSQKLLVKSAVKQSFPMCDE